GEHHDFFDDRVEDAVLKGFVRARIGERGREWIKRPFALATGWRRAECSEDQNQHGVDEEEQNEHDENRVPYVGPEPATRAHHRLHGRAYLDPSALYVVAPK